MIRYIHFNPVRAGIVSDLVVAYIATRKLGLAGAAVARTLGVSNPAILKAASKGPDVLADLGWAVAELVMSLPHQP